MRAVAVVGNLRDSTRRGLHAFSAGATFPSMRSRLSPVLPVALVMAALASAAPLRAQGPAPADAVAQQIDVGGQWFRARCTECHEKGDLSDANFQLKWGGQSAFDLLDLIVRTMPEDEPGGLTRGTYTAIVAYLMKLNGMPAGTAMLPSDSTALRGIRLTFARAAATSTPP